MSVNPPRPKGPPLNAMRAFEAAARHESIVRAAGELSVSPGAVSQHVKTLEGWAGIDLFRRNAQGIKLTAAGRSLVEGFTSAFDALSDATHDLRNLAAKTEIHIAALPSIAQLWLPSRLGRIRAAFPEMKFSVTAMETPPNLTRELFDLWLFIGAAGNHADELIVAPDEIFPVSSPLLADRVREPEQLNSITLLHDQTWNRDWADWSEASGVALDDALSGPSYSLYSLAVEEAKAGAGALMGHRILIDAPLRDGGLVALPGPVVVSGRALILGLPHKTRRRAELEDVVRLLCE